MNPVTQGLLKQVRDDGSLEAFAQDWEDLESLIIEVYRQKSVSFEQQEQFFALKERLRNAYAEIQNELFRYWPLIRVKGELVVGDPYLALLDKSSAKEFVENWDAMRTLPAAREALNQMLMARIEAT